MVKDSGSHPVLSVFCSPSRYVQGRDATRQLPQEILRLGIKGPCLILASPTAFSLLENIWRESFEQAGLGIEVVVFGGECTRAEVARLVREVDRIGASSLIGAGGGKTIDTARAVAHESGVPVVCCPTTAASDAPCSALSVVYHPDGDFESYLLYPRNPDLILVDTEVIAKAPVRHLVAGMGDALATRFEAEAARQAFRTNTVGGLSTMAGAALANLCYQTLLADGEAAIHAVRVGAVTPALERVVEANTLLSGIGFESGGLALAHAVHNGLTVAPETHAFLHGEKVAFGTLVQLVMEGRDQSIVDEVMGFCVRVGLPITLGQLGLDQLSETLLFRIAERVVADGETSHNMAFPVSQRSVAEALLATNAMGSAWLESSVLS